MSAPDASPDPALDNAAASDPGVEPSDGDASRLTQRIVAAVAGADVRLTMLALVAALVVGALFLVLSDARTLDAATSGAGLGAVLQAAARAVSRAYSALLQGSLGSPGAISETLVAATVLILTGLAVTIPLRAGLFNIGGEGQVIAGGLVGGYVGFAVEGLPLVVHLPLAIVAALLGGAFIGWVPGVLKARTGAHEVISTIMLNNTLNFVAIWLLTTTLFQIPGRADPISRDILDTARLPRPFTGLRVDVGIILALLVAIVVLWLLDRSTIGFELNAVGANPSAATAAGMDVGTATMRAMTFAGVAGGLAGGALILGVQGRITPGFSAGLGFDGITVALLGRGTVGGTVAAGLLLGALKAGGRAMQARSGTSLDLVVVIQALIIVFIAAPGLVRAIFRVRTEPTSTTSISQGWGA
ncbi:MAG: ABC transporter permease [Actinomycetota bacterium]|nr:ABC transporter permease [Actinomycetota bacterium]